MADSELEAMQAVFSALSALDEDARRRVVVWASDKLAISVPRSAPPASGISEEGGDDRTSPFEEFGDLFHAVGPKTDKEKALVAAYWLRASGTSQFQSQELNTMLKNLGYGVGNITDALTSAMKERPALVIQMKKSGSSRQARKSYKLTDAGSKWVESQLAGGAI